MSFLRNRLALVALLLVVSCGQPQSIETSPTTEREVTTTTLDERERIEAVRLYQAVALYTATERWEATRLWLDALEAAELAERREREAAARVVVSPPIDWPVSLRPCGGDLPPCYVKRRESGGDYGAVNPTGCGGFSCGGAWQFDPRTWNGYGGYQFAQDAPPEVQDAKARELWDGGNGCSHWSAC